MLIPYATINQVRLFAGRAQDVTADFGPVACVLTEPPYRGLAHCARWEAGLEDDHTTDPEPGKTWHMEQAMWVRGWYRAIVAVLPKGHPAWIFASLYHAGAMGIGIFSADGTLRRTWARVGGSEQDEQLWLGGDAHMTTAQAGAIRDTMQAATATRAGLDAALLDLLLTYSPPGLVLDPFCGTGHTLAAAVRAGRPAIGIDRDPAVLYQALRRVGEARPT